MGSMTITTQTITIETGGGGEMINLTPRAEEAIASSGCTSGLVTFFVTHTTAAVVVSEFEPGLVEDLPQAIQRLAPADAGYRHNQLNQDDNAHSHILGSLLGPSVTIPFDQRRLLLGTWQQIVLIELDTHPRRRSVVIQVIGE
jgi:secondary thiamine-phosphate synthase enzyme